MKHAAMLACLAALAFHAPSWADERIDGLKKMNREGCLQTVQFEEHAPKDPKQIQLYCTCTYDTYFDGFSKIEQEQIVTGGAPAALKKSLPERLKQAQAQCRKKLGI
jgi:hypothetical protein